MRVILLRHAKAFDRTLFKKTNNKDSERPLTKEGKRLMLANARAIKKLFPEINKIFVSPYRRAEQTAKILQQTYKKNVEKITIKELIPSQPIEKLLAILVKESKNQCIVLVGHEPHLSKVFGYFVLKEKTTKILLKKGAICVLEFSGTPKPGGAKLVCLAQPQMLQLVRI